MKTRQQGGAWAVSSPVRVGARGRRASLAAVALIFAAVAGARGGDLVWEQVGSPLGPSEPSSDFVSPWQSYDVEVADDFTLNGAVTEVWALGENVPFLSPGAWVRFYEIGPGGVPGALLAEYSFSSGDSNLLLNSNVIHAVLPEPFAVTGGAFVSVQHKLNAGSSNPTVASHWEWKGTLNGFPNGAPSVIRNPGGGWGDICQQWCATRADRIFRLYGSSDDPPPPPPVPSIAAIAEAAVARSGRFVIMGSGFTADDHSVLLNGAPTPHATWTDGEIHAYALGDTALGPATVQVVTPGGASNISSIAIESMPRGTGRVKWRFQADHINISHRAGVTVDGAVHFSDSGGDIYALDADGGLKWIFNMIGGGDEGPVVVGGDDTIYVAGNPLGPDVTIHALGPDGSLRWMFFDTNTEGLIAGPAVGPDGDIYAVTDIGGLGAMALSPDGDLIWSNTGTPTLQEFAQVGAEIVFGPRGLDGEMQLCVAFDEFTLEDRLYAFSLDGTQRFETITGAGDDPVAQFQAQPAIGAPDGSIYVVDFGPGGGAGWALKSFDPDDGSLNWTALDDGTNALTAPTTGSDGVVYVIRNLAQIHAITPTGESHWQRITSNIYDIGVVAPDNSMLVLGGVPDFGMPGFVEAVGTLDGEALWRVELPQEDGGNIVPSSRAMFSTAGDTVYIGTAHLVFDGDAEHSYLYAIDATRDGPLPADLDGDGDVDGGDLGTLLGAWGGAGAADLDGDGTVDGADLGILLGAWTE